MTKPPTLKKDLVLLATTTEEKEALSRLASQTLPGVKGESYPVEVRSIYDVVPYFHSAEEAGQTDRENANEKIDAINSTIEAIRNNPERLKQCCDRWGIPYNQENILESSNIKFATDDTILRFRDKHWRVLADKLRPYVSETLLTKARNGGTRDVDYTGPGSEIGPIIAAVGLHPFIQMVHESALEAGIGEKNIPVLRQTTWALRPLMASKHMPTTSITADSTLFLNFDKKRKYNHLPDSTDYYLTDNHGRIIADHIAEMVKTTLPHGKLLKQLAKPLRKGSNTYRYQAPPEFTLGFMPSLISNSNTHQGILLSPTRNADAINSVTDEFAIHEPDNAKNPIVIPANNDRNAAISAASRILSTVEDLMHASDGFIMLPPSISGGSHSLADKFLQLFSLFSFEVAKQTFARDMKKPMVVVNIDGEYDEAINLHYSLVNQGMNKDHPDYQPLHIPGMERNGPNARKNKKKSGTLHSNSYFDVISGESAHTKKLLNNALTVLKSRAKTYERRENYSFTKQASGTPPPEEMFKVAIFTSASNDNKILNDDIKTLSHDLVMHDTAILYGAGDRHAMGAVYEGFKEARDTLKGKPSYIAGYSTAPLIETETQYGRFPTGLNYSMLCSHIYERMAHLVMEPNAVIGMPGGAGTVQEITAALLLKQLMPEQMHDTPIILYNQKLVGNYAGHFWDALLKNIFTEAQYTLMSKEPDTLSDTERKQREYIQKETGIYVDYSLKEIQEDLSDTQKNWRETVSLAHKRPHKNTHAGVG